DVEAAAVLLGDQPLISPAAIERLISERGAGRVAVRATYGGHPGHPVVLERSLFQSIVELRGDAGARNLLERADVAGVPCEDVADPLDVDSPADLRLAEVKLGPVGLGRGLDESAPSSG
ncbi:MAG: nucleotidyltransferase family protein, partial [Solirubrobacterales bacterium]